MALSLPVEAFPFTTRFCTLIGYKPVPSPRPDRTHSSAGHDGRDISAPLVRPRLIVTLVGLLIYEGTGEKIQCYNLRCIYRGVPIKGTECVDYCYIIQTIQDTSEVTRPPTARNEASPGS
jgi:hypothetical protein